ncbi:MAG: molybdate ABC transporter permease subunit [Jiangellaceae bacterium]|nr:molybdate ABC transporter permease subunit [Jiangellaceae bacterium]
MTTPGARPHPLLVAPAVTGLILLLAPVAGLVARLPWIQLPQILSAESMLPTLRLSLLTATLTTAVSLLCGGSIGWLLARTTLPGRALLRGLVTVPLVLPPVVGGIALLVAFGRNGLVGRWLDEAFGVTLPFTTAAVVLAQTFVSMPFVVVSIEGTLRAVDRRHEDIAATLGASGWTTFRRVTLPAIVPGVVAGAVLCWARALGEFGATVTFAGSFPGTTRTLSLEAYAAITGGDPRTAVVLSVLMIVVAVGVLAALRDRWLGLR